MMHGQKKHQNMQYISFFGYMFRFLQNRLQATVNYMEVQSVYIHYGTP